MRSIPSKCPNCGSSEHWGERINPLTTGAPIGKHVRLRLLNIHGLLAYPIKKALGFYKVEYRCEKCGYKNKYDLQ